METQINQALILAQIILSLFFIILFGTMKGNRKANFFITSFLVLFILFALCDLNNIFIPEHHFYTVYLISSVALLTAFPVFYFYILSLYNIRVKKALFHFIIPIIGFLILLPGLFKNWPSPGYYNNFMIFDTDQKELTKWTYFVANDLFFTIQIIIYSLFIWRIIKTIRPCLEENYSNLEGKKLKWVVYLLILLASMYLFYFIIELFTNFPLENYDFVYYCFSLLFLLSVIYGAFRQNEHFYVNESNRQTRKSISSHKHATIQLSQDETRSFQQKLIQLTKKEKFYMQRDLTLPELAKMLNTNKNTLSQFLNQNLNQNFYRYINSLRVEEAKKLLTENETNKYSLEGIGYMAGFNSKTTFNTVFKTQTGMSPSEYKNTY